MKWEIEGLFHVLAKVQDSEINVRSCMGEVVMFSNQTSIDGFFNKRCS